MLFANLFRRARQGPRPTGRTPHAGPRRKPSLPRREFVPRLEGLEDRSLPSTFTVMNLHDSGAGSLRQAVLSADAHPGPDVIRFAPGLHGTISLTSGQLGVTDDVTT